MNNKHGSQTAMRTTETMKRVMWRRGYKGSSRLDGEEGLAAAMLQSLRPWREGAVDIHTSWGRAFQAEGTGVVYTATESKPAWPERGERRGKRSGGGQRQNQVEESGLHFNCGENPWEGSQQGVMSSNLNLQNHTLSATGQAKVWKQSKQLGT